MGNSKNPEAYKKASILFGVSGFIFIVLGAFANIAFLAVGVALIIVGLVIRQHKES